MSPKPPPVQNKMPHSSADRGHILSASVLHENPPNSIPTELIMLNAVCQLAGKNGLALENIPEIAAEGGDRDHGSVDLGAKFPVEASQSLLQSDHCQYSLTIL